MSSSPTLAVGTYTRRESFVDGKAEGIYLCGFDPATGALEPRATIRGEGTTNPSFLAPGPDGRCVYAVNEIAGADGSAGAVAAFAVDRTGGGLAFLGRRSTGGLAPCFLSVEPSGAYVFASNYEGGSVCVLPIGSDGRLGEASHVVQHSGRGPHPERQAGPHPHMVVPTPRGRFVLVTDLGLDRLVLYALDREAGCLSALPGGSIDLPAGSGPRHVAFHPNGRLAYAVGELDSTVTPIHLDEEWGSLQAGRPVSTLPPGQVGANLAAEVAVSPCGRSVYVSNRGHDSIAHFRIDAQSGDLCLLRHTPSGGRTPRHFTIHPSGRWLLVANQDSDAIVSFPLAAEDGALRSPAQRTDVPTPVCLRFLAGPA